MRERRKRFRTMRSIFSKVLYGGLEISRLKFSIKKDIYKKFHLFFFLYFLVIKTLDPDWIRIHFKCWIRITTLLHSFMKCRFVSTWLNNAPPPLQWGEGGPGKEDLPRVVAWWESQFRPFFSATASALLLRVSRAVSCKLNNCLKRTDREKKE